MKQVINLDQEELSPFERRFIDLWREKKGYPQTPELTLSQVIELNLATTYTFFKDDSETRFFNNVLTGEESVIAWDGLDGEELIDCQFFQVLSNIKKRIAHGRTFNEIDPI